jgi:hypothetical protein
VRTLRTSGWSDTTLTFSTDCDAKLPSGSMRVAQAMPWIVETACGLSDTVLPFCPTPAPASVPVTGGTVPSPAPPILPRDDPTCKGINNCANVIKQQCGCPQNFNVRTSCANRVVNQKCCSTATRRYNRRSYTNYRSSCGFSS